MISLVFDTETTGLPLPSVADLEKQPRIIELALSKIEDGKLISKHSWLINPEQKLEAVITKITGLTDDDLKDKPRFIEVAEEIADVFKSADVLIAHNAPFDVSLLAFELKRAGIENEFPWPAETLCTVQEFRHLFGFHPSLQVLYEKILGKELAQTHRAQDDVDALVEILMKEGIV